MNSSTAAVVFWAAFASVVVVVVADILVIIVPKANDRIVLPRLVAVAAAVAVAVVVAAVAVAVAAAAAAVVVAVAVDIFVTALPRANGRIFLPLHVVAAAVPVAVAVPVLRPIKKHLRFCPVVVVENETLLLKKMDVMNIASMRTKEHAAFVYPSFSWT